MANILSVKVKNRKIKPLEDLFKKWAHLNDLYTKALKEDSPYFYSERTNCGMINAAAYATDRFVALEELKVDRENIGGHVNNGGNPRYDLYLYDTKEKSEYIIETKLSWTRREIEQKIADAENQIKSISSEYHGDINLAMVFAVVGFNDINDDILKNHINELDNIKTCLTVHYYPDSTRNLHGSGGFANYIYPGVSILMRVVDQ